jgi:hypothetical protein
MGRGGVRGVRWSMRPVGEGGSGTGGGCGGCVEEWEKVERGWEGDVGLTYRRLRSGYLGGREGRRREEEASIGDGEIVRSFAAGSLAKAIWEGPGGGHCGVLPAFLFAKGAQGRELWLASDCWLGVGGPCIPRVWSATSFEVRWFVLLDYLLLLLPSSSLFFFFFFFFFSLFSSSSSSSSLLLLNDPPHISIAARLSFGSRRLLRHIIAVVLAVSREEHGGVVRLTKPAKQHTTQSTTTAHSHARIENDGTGDCVWPTFHGVYVVYM